MKSLFSLLCVIGTLAYAGTTLTPVGRLRLLDGRTLENVVIRSYDVQASKALVLSNGKAMLIPINLIPPPYADKVIADSARPSSTSTCRMRAAPIGASRPRWTSGRMTPPFPSPPWGAPRSRMRAARCPSPTGARTASPPAVRAAS